MTSSMSHGIDIAELALHASNRTISVDGQTVEGTWSLMPIPRRARRCGSSFVMSSPAMLISPAVGSRRPEGASAPPGMGKDEVFYRNVNRMLEITDMAFERLAAPPDDGKGKRRRGSARRQRTVRPARRRAR